VLWAAAGLGLLGLGARLERRGAHRPLG
jgi:hypothetical protein